MSIFKSKSFDSIISKGTEIKATVGSQLSLTIAPDERLVVEGTIENASTITGRHVDGKVSGKTTFAVQGGSVSAGKIEVFNVIIDGTVKAKELRAEGTLALNSGARLDADVVYYRTLVIEKGAVIMATLKHLDHVSEGEAL